MKDNFEEKFMELQADLISLCLEITDKKVDKIYAYASIEDKSNMFNAFFETGGEIITVNKLNIDKREIMQFLRIGTYDLEKIKRLCKEYDVKTPTELKMYYDVKKGSYKADYKYDVICSSKTGISAGEVFMEWFNEVSKL